MSQICNFSRVSRCRRFYRNEHGHVRQNRPNFETCCNDPIPAEALDRFRSRNRLDSWSLVVRLYYTGHDWDEFTNSSAEARYQAYAAFIFQRRGK